MAGEYSGSSYACSFQTLLFYLAYTHGPPKTQSNME